MVKKFILLLSSVLIANMLCARTISGEVLDGSGAPLEYAGVVLLDADSAFVKSCVTAANGSFCLQDSAAVGSWLSIQNLGYSSLLIELPQDEKDINVGRQVMSESTTALSEVVVTARRPTTVMKGGSLITTVEKTLLASSGTAKDVLGQLPTVTVQNDAVNVLGRGTPIIYIDNRLVRNDVEIEQLKSSDIKNVEVISLPGARYASTVRAVIRITTTGNRDNGWSISGRTENTYNSNFSTQDQLNINYRYKKLDVFSMLYLSNNVSTGNEDLYIWSKHSDKEYEQYLLTDAKLAQLSMQGKLGFNYRFNENHSIGGYYQSSQTKGADGNDYTTQIFENGNLSEQTVAEMHGKSKTSPTHSASMYYWGKVGDLTIDFNADMSNSQSSSSSNQLERGVDISRELHTEGKGKSELYAEKLVLEYPLWKGHISVGQELTSAQSVSEQIGDEDILKSSDSKIEELNSGFFAEIAQGFGKFNAAAGLRYEHVSYEYYSNGKPVDDQSRTYNNFFPTLSASAQFGGLGMSLSYVDRTGRPGYSQLSGTTEYINRLLYKRGDPFLKQSRTREITALSFWKDMYVHAAYSWYNNPVMFTYVPYENNNEANVITYINGPAYERMIISAAYSPTFGIWRPRLQVTYIQQFLEMEFGDIKADLNDPVVSLSLRNTFTLPADIVVNLNMSWKSAGSSECGRTSSSSNMYFRVYKQFFNRRMMVSLEANDIFEKSSSTTTVYGHNIKSEDLFLSNSRYVGFTLSFNLNVKKDYYKGKGAGNKEKQRF